MVDSMKWQLICFSCSVNQFITKRKHTHTHSAKFSTLIPPISEDFAKFSLGIDRQVEEPTAAHEFHMPLEISHVRHGAHTHAHIHLAYHQFAH